MTQPRAPNAGSTVGVSLRWDWVSTLAANRENATAQGAARKLLCSRFE